MLCFGYDLGVIFHIPVSLPCSPRFTFGKPSTWSVLAQMQLIHELRVVDIRTDRRGAIDLYTPPQTGEMIPASIITRLLWMELIYPKVTNFPRMSLDAVLRLGRLHSL
jgi:hypothetical protein